MTPNWTAVAATDQVEGERPLAVEVAGVSLALARIEGECVATFDRCPHMSFPLSEGFVRDGKWVCSLHRWEFDLLDPDPRTPPEARCRRIPTREKDGQVYVDLDAVLPD